MSPAPTSTGSFVTAVFNGVPANLCLISWSDPPPEMTEKKKYTSPAQTMTAKTASGPHPRFGRNESIHIDSYPDYAVNATPCFTTNPKSTELRATHGWCAWVCFGRSPLPYATPIAMAAEAQAASDTPVRIAQSRTSPSRRRSTLIEPTSIVGRPSAAVRRWKERLVGVDHRAEPVLTLLVVFSASIVTSSSPTYEGTGRT